MKTSLSIFSKKKTSRDTISEEARIEAVEKYWQKRASRQHTPLSRLPIIVNLSAVLTCECMDEEQLKQLTKKLCLISQGGSA